MGKLLQPEFDQASFLYNMYKSCTMGEIEEFKISLQDVREGTVVGASMDQITSKSNEISQLVKDMIQLDTSIKIKISPAVTKLEETSQKIQQSLLTQIQELQSQAQRLVMTQKCEEILRESQLVYECLQKVSYAYSFAQNKILDPLSLSVALKRLSVLSPEQKRKLAANIPQIAVKLELLKEIQQMLQKQNLAKFQESFDNKDRQNLVQCIQVFFNMEILSDQIQNRTNIYLKQLHSFWQKNIQELNEQIQQQASRSDEAQLVDRSMGAFIEQMTQATMKVYTMSLALSEQDPTSSAATSFDAMQETLQQTGLSNVFRLYWDMLCKILRMRIQAASTDYPYVYGVMASRYPAFLQSLKFFWEQVLSQIQPTDKIRLLELKQSMFGSISALKQNYFDNYILKQLMEYRMQISEVLSSSFENLDKYKIVAQKQKNEQQKKIVNPYTALAESMQQAQDLKTQERSFLHSSVGDLLQALHLVLETVNTQLDLRNQVIEICKGQLTSLLQTDLLNNIVKFQITETQEYEHQLAFNMVIFDLAKQVAQYFNSSRFKELVETDNKLQVSQNSHIKKDFEMKNFQRETQDICCKLFEKVYSVFISHLKTQIYPNLARVFGDLPKPLKENDLQFGEPEENDNSENEESKNDNQNTFQDRLETWKQSHIDELFSFFIPQAVKQFNTDFKAILSKMTLENMVQSIDPAAQNDHANQWIHRDRKIRLIECVDEILHFFLIRTIQMDFTSYSSEQRDQVHDTLVSMYHSLVSSFEDLVEISTQSRMVQKHQKFLILIKEEHEGIDENQIPFHLRLCLGQSQLKTISVRNLYICDRGGLKAKMLNQSQLAKNATMTYEKTLQDIRKAFVLPNDGQADAQALIQMDEKLAMIDAKLATLTPLVNSEEKE